MPEYTFNCMKCDSYFSIVCSIDQYDDILPTVKCSNCKSKKVIREYSIDNIHGHVNEIRTVGQLAEKNMKKYGNELVSKMREEHKTKREEGLKELPNGMKRVRKVEDFKDTYTRQDWLKKGKK